MSDNPGDELVLELFDQYKREVCHPAIQKINDYPENSIREFILPLREIITELLEQNECLLRNSLEIEQTALLHLKESKMEVNEPTPCQLDCDSSADAKNLLRILKQLVKKSDILLDEYTFHTIDRDELEEIITEWKNCKREEIVQSCDEDNPMNAFRYSEEVRHGGYVSNAMSFRKYWFKVPCSMGDHEVNDYRRRGEKYDEPAHAGFLQVFGRMPAVLLPLASRNL